MSASISRTSARVGTLLPAAEPSRRPRRSRLRCAGAFLSKPVYSTHHAVRYAVAHDYASFVSRGALRPAIPCHIPRQFGSPTSCYSGTDEQATARFAEESTAWLSRLPADVKIIGPAPCPVERIKNRWRWHAVIKAEHPAELTRLGLYFMRRVAHCHRPGSSA